MATNSKMFVHYSGTKAAFIAAGLPSQYTNKIVFIKGGESGTGACVYTHGAYYANVEEAIAALKFFSKVSANGVTAEAAGNNGTINFTADDPASVSVKVDSTGVHFGLTDEFKTAVNTTLPNRIKAIEDDYLKAADKTELEGKVASSLAEAKNYTDDEVARIVADSGSGLIGTAEDTSDKNTIYGAKKYADEKAAAAQSAAEATAAADATSKVNAAKEEIKGVTDGLGDRVKAIEDDYLTSADKTEAINAGKVSIAEAAGTGDILKTYTFTQNGETIGTINLAKDLVVSGGEVIEKDGVKYLQLTIANQEAPVEIPVADLVDVYTGSTYIAISESNEISVKFADLDAALAAETTTVGAAIKAADTKGAQGIADAATAQAAAEAAQGTADANAGRLDVIEDDYLKAADKTELQGNIDTKVAQADYDAKVAELEGYWEWEEL